MPRRLKLLRISPEAIADLLRLDGSRRVRIEGLPADARLVAISSIFGRDLFAFQVESAEFPEVLSGMPLDELRLNVTEWVDEPADTPSLINRLGGY